MTRDRYKIYDEAKPHFITSTIVGWLPLFSQPEIANIIFESLKYLQRNDNLKIYGYVLMENHIHMIIAEKEITKIIARFKSYTARKILDYLVKTNQTGILHLIRGLKLDHKHDRDYQLWQEGVHPVQIFDEYMMRVKLEYIHYNPVRRGYVDEPIHWRYSSARNYAGMKSDLDVVVNWF